jgi:outer membrane protein OmpA-like peptidoglycan-associated protein
MLMSTKIKILGVVGTLAIISTAFTLHANVFYEELYNSISTNKVIKEESEVQKRIDIKSNIISDVKKDSYTELNSSIQSAKIIATKESSIIEKKDLPSISIKSDPTSELERVLRSNRYLYIDEEKGEIKPTSKEALKMLKPLLSKLDDIYLEVEGYSASKESSYVTQKDSEKFALIVSAFIKSLGIDKEIVITAYGDNYPIIDDKTDDRNSRVELKIRRR